MNIGSFICDSDNVKEVTADEAYRFVATHGLQTAVSGMELHASVTGTLDQLRGRIVANLCSAQLGAYVDGKLYLSKAVLSQPAWRCWLAGTSMADEDSPTQRPGNWNTLQDRARLRTLR